MLVVVVFLVDKGFHSLYRSVVLNIVNGSCEFIQTCGRNMGGRLHGQTCHQTWYYIAEVLETSLVRGRFVSY